MAFCLPDFAADTFKQLLKDGTIDPAKLAEMTSGERRTFFQDFLTEEHAKEVNALFESKLLLKDQKAGMIRWAKQVTGLKPEAQRDIISRIERMDNVLSAETEQAFLEDLASRKLGTAVTFEEATTITELSNAISETKDAAEASPKGSAERLDYGARYVALQNYLAELKVSNGKTSLGDIKTKLKESPGTAIWDGIKSIAGTAKGLKASFDDSFAGRQGFKAIFTNPILWGDNFARSLGYIGKQIVRSPKNNSIMNSIKADIYSRPNALDGTYKAMKLDIGLTSEEAFPTSLPERIWILGRFYKASETAYNGMALRLRADIADKVIDVAKNNGVDISDTFQIESLGRLVNSLTGRGHIGRGGETVNLLFFSPRSLKASFDFLTLHSTDKMSAYARRQAGYNFLKVAAGMALILGTAKALNPDSVELDPRSADFGKIRIGDTRFDVSGGMSSLVVLAARIVTLSSKSSTSHKITSLHSGKYGANDAFDVLVDFATNKASPAAGLLINQLKGKDFKGDPLTPVGELKNFLAPLPFTNVEQLMKNPNAANVVLAEIADALGFVTNTYSAKKP